MSEYRRDVRARLNPRRLTILDVIAAGTGIQRNWISLYYRRGWPETICWLVLLTCGSGLVLLTWALRQLPQ